MAKKQTIKHMIHSTLREKIAFGESKHFDKRELGFGESTYKIYSYSTYDTYLKECMAYGEWLKDNKGISKITDLSVTEQYAKEYIQYRLSCGVSVYTAKLERSALSMLYGKRIEIEMPKRKNKAIKRSREETSNDRHISRGGKHKDIFTVALATGTRRCDIKNLNLDSLIEKNGLLYLKIERSKGGRDRLAPILEEYRQDIIDIFEQAKKDEKTRLFEHIPAKIDVHGLL